MHKNWRVDLIEHVDEFSRTYCYERYEGLLAIADIKHGNKYKLPCEACRKFGT